PGQPIRGIVRDADRLVLRVERDHRDDRAEDLLAGDPPRVVDVGEHAGPEEEAGAMRNVTTRHDLRALLHADLDVVERRLPLPVADERTHLGRFLQRRADTDRIGPRREPGPGSTLSVPSGSPASVRMSATARIVSGVCEAGFRIAVFPQASAGAIFQLAITVGKFHGEIRTQTPTGSRRLMSRPPGTT